MHVEKRHIGILCTTHALGGMELLFLRLAGWMHDRGWPVTALGHRGTPFFLQAASYSVDAAAVPHYKKYFDFRGAKALAGVLKGVGVEVLFFSANRDVNTAVLAKRFFHPALKAVFMQQMQIGVAKRDIVHTWQYRGLDAWVAPLEWLAGQARTQTHIWHDKIHTIPYGIDTARFTGAAANRRTARVELGLPQDAFIAGTIGRFDEGKNQEVLIRAAGILETMGEPIHVLLVGEDTRGEMQDYGRRLHETAATLGLQDRVHFGPFREDVQTAFAALDAFVMTTPAETYGLVTLEALASGIPVIAANGGGSPELLDFGAAGILVPPRDEQALADALAGIRSDSGTRERLAVIGPARVTERYSHTVQCEGTEQLIASLYG